MEACGFRDAYSTLERHGLAVVGISADSPVAQLKFKQKYDLPYTLLADAEKRVAAAYGVMKEKNMYGRKVMGIARTSFLIDASGKIVRIFENLKPEGHAAEVLAAVKKK